MNNPYEVLGVSRTSNEREIKSAYKEMVKKYHPDQYQNSPVADLAEEKMAQVNAAYDQIMNERKNGGSTYTNNTAYSQGSNAFNNAEIRTLIQNRELARAEMLLDSVTVAQQNAEWYFLKGSVFYARGWLNEAYANFQTACKMQPNNPEYLAALNQMNNQRNGYMRGNPNPSYHQGRGDDTLDCCMKLYCADCCCECMGGDLIPCL